MGSEALSFPRQRPSVYEDQRTQRLKEARDRIRQRRAQREKEQQQNEVTINAIRNELREAIAKRQEVMEQSWGTNRIEVELELAVDATEMISEVTRRATEDWVDRTFAATGKWPTKQEQAAWEQGLDLEDFLTYLNGPYKAFLEMMEDEEYLKVQRALSRMITSQLTKSP